MRFLMQRQKRPSERLRLSIDVAKDVAKIPGDSVSELEVKAFNKAGGEVTSPQVEGVSRNGTVGYCWFKAGTSKDTYEVNFKFTTAQGAIYEHGISVPVDALA